MPRTPVDGPSAPAPAVQTTPLVSLEHIGVVFGSVVALDDVSLSLAPGSRHAVVGENGAGKSTLMKVLFGLLAPSTGQINLDNAPRVFSSPSDAIRSGIGMVQQHFELIGSFTAAQNIVLGAEKTRAGGIFLSARQSEQAVRALGDESGLSVKPNARVDELSVAAQQRVEILKALYRKARVLILDEPTATLAPSEARDLWSATARLAQSGTTVVFVTHKLSDVMAHADEVTVLRKGRHVFSGKTQDTTPAELAAHMVGSSASPTAAPRHDGIRSAPVLIPLSPAAPEKNSHQMLHRAALREKGVPALSLKNVMARGRRGETVLENLSLDIAPGEIVGLAGVDGSGQKEVLEIIMGLHPITEGQIILIGSTMNNITTEGRRSVGVGYVPEDRHHRALILPFSCEENAVLGMQQYRGFATYYAGLATGVLKQKVMAGFLEEQTRAFDVRGAQIGLPVKNLSGGNQQKLVLARELSRDPALLLVSQPTRGLDFGASAFVHQSLRTARDNGMAMLLHSLDLDEILALSDRVAVMLGGQIVGIVSGEQKNEKTIGALMTGAKETIAA